MSGIYATAKPLGASSDPAATECAHQHDTRYFSGSTGVLVLSRILHNHIRSYALPRLRIRPSWCPTELNRAYLVAIVYSLLRQDGDSPELRTHGFRALSSFRCLTSF